MAQQRARRLQGILVVVIAGLLFAAFAQVADPVAALRNQIEQSYGDDSVKGSSTTVSTSPPTTDAPSTTATTVPWVVDAVLKSCSVSGGTYTASFEVGMSDRSTIERKITFEASPTREGLKRVRLGNTKSLGLDVTADSCTAK